MTVINFAHPLTAEHLRQLAELASDTVDRVIDVRTQFDNERSFVEQVRELVASVGLSSSEWQTSRLVVNLPALASIAALLLADLHGRMGHFPAIVRMKPDPRSPVPTFVVAEVLDLQTVRDKSRETRRNE